MKNFGALGYCKSLSETTFVRKYVRSIQNTANMYVVLETCAFQIKIDYKNNPCRFFLTVEH